MRRFRRLRIVAEASLWLAFYRMVLAVVPFKRIVAAHGMTPSDPTKIPASMIGPGRPERATNVAWAVQVAARWTPWKTTCLVQALTGVTMLRLRRLPSVLFLGVGRDEAEGLAAHSWVDSSGRTVTGQTHPGAFSAVAAYTRPVRS